MRNVLLIVFVLFLSCNKKEVQLPETHLNTITEILDVSPVYMFYNEDNDSIEFNRNNLISTTNWLVNIDKRLTLKQILPHLQYLQEKRQKSGMHENENARNFFTCFNPETKGLSFIDFTSIEFDRTLVKKESLAEHLDVSPALALILIYFGKDEYVSFSGNIDESTTISSTEHFERDLDSLIRSNNYKKDIYIEFSGELSFQEYISYKSILSKFNDKNIEVKATEFIHI